MRLTGLAVVTQLFLSATSMQRKRAALTVAAIAWGTVAIVMLLSFGEGLKIQMGRSKRGMGDNLAVWWPGETSKVWQGLPMGRPIRPIVYDVPYLAGRMTAASDVIGGIGVANIMYAVVKEKTREIGVQMALGARRAWVTGPFVLQGLVYTLLGGGVGLALSIVLIVLLGLVPVEGNRALEFLGKPTLNWQIACGTAAILGLVADEPTGNLDTGSGSDVMSLLVEHPPRGWWTRAVGKQNPSPSAA